MKQCITKILLLLPIIFLLGGCFLDRSVIGAPARMTVEPALFCPGDSVTVSWNATGTPRHPIFCAEHGREYLTPIMCEASNTCPGGHAANACLDGYCCPRSVYEGNSEACPTADGCYADFELTITGDTLSAPVVDGEDYFLTGEQQVTPSDTTEFLMHFTHAGLENPVEQTRTATMIMPESSIEQPVTFYFTCNGSTPTWTQLDMDSPLFASEHVQIAAVRNISRNTIQVSGGDPMRGRVTLRPGESTEMLNGRPNGIWIATLSPLDPASLHRPRCGPTDTQNPWPDLEVEFDLVCVAN